MKLLKSILLCVLFPFIVVGAYAYLLWLAWYWNHIGGGYPMRTPSECSELMSDRDTYA